MKTMNQCRDRASQHPRFAKFLLFVGSLLVSLMVAEGLFQIYIRLFEPLMANKISRFRAVATVEDSLSAYTSHPYLAYVRSDHSLKKDGILIKKHFFPWRKNPNVIRVACLGGSTTMNKYPLFLEEDLTRYSLGRQFEVMDFGCNGWTLMESLINYAIRVSDFSPDVVLVHHGMNDSFPRIWPDYRLDYSHYRISWQNQSGILGSKIFSYSWLLSYFQIQNNISRSDLRNYTVHRVRNDELNMNLDRVSLETYRSNLMKLAELVRASGARIVFAPMAYRRGEIAYKHTENIIEQNDCMREVASEMKVPLVEVDSLLKDHPESFIDIVHLYNPGIRLKSAVYASAIWRTLHDVPLKPDWDNFKNALFPDSRSWTPRTLEIQWDLDVKEISDFHVYVLDELLNDYVYLGHTGNGMDCNLLWSKGSSLIARKFMNGPIYGRNYQFEVFAISQNGSPAFYGPFKNPGQVKVVERVENQEENR